MYPEVDFLYLNEQEMIKAGVKNMPKCIDTMEDVLKCLTKGDFVMGGENHNSHGCMVTFPNESPFPNMPKNVGEDRRFMAMPAYIGGPFDMAGMKWYGSNTANKEIGLPRSILMVMLNDKTTGAPVCLMSGNLLSAYRKMCIRDRVVADRFCFGSLPGRDEIILNDTEDVLTQICRQYMEWGQCPRFMNTEKIIERQEYVDAIAKEYKADGLIYEQIKFCDYWGYERASAFHVMKEKYGYPVLSIDRPYAVGTSGQLRTRDVYKRQVQIIRNWLLKCGGYRLRNECNPDY